MRDYIATIVSILGLIITLTGLSSQQLRVVSLVGYVLLSVGMLWLAFRSRLPRIWRWAALGALYLITIPFFIWVGSWIETQDNKQTASLTPTPTLTPEIYRTYEWQWAGENWYGRLAFDERKGQNVITEAKVGLINKECTTDRIWMDGKVLELADESTFEITDSGIVINLTVKKMDKRTGEPVRETIRGSLQQTLCYTGKVIYSSAAGDFEGDMILVGKPSSSLSPQVEDWFRDPNVPWANYEECALDQTSEP